MIISFEVPGIIESQIRAGSADFLVELYRDQKITHHQLGRALELTDYETDGLLKRYGVGDDPSLEKFERQRAFMEA